MSSYILYYILESIPTDFDVDFSDSNVSDDSISSDSNVNNDSSLSNLNINKDLNVTGNNNVFSTDNASVDTDDDFSNDVSDTTDDSNYADATYTDDNINLYNNQNDKNTYQQIQKYIIYQKLRTIQAKLDKIEVKKMFKDVDGVHEFITNLNYILQFYKYFNFNEINELLNNIVTEYGVLK